MEWMDKSRIRNFCIIAHIDHGKSTLADRLMQFTGAVEDRDLTEQHLDTMELERERGITIKAQAVRLSYTARDGRGYELNLIDTPGHVDFTYEVSRSLAACEGALLLIDATQGIQAQTMANIYLAMEHDLSIIPVINKIDLPGAEPERVAGEIEQSFGFTPQDIQYISAKTGKGVLDLLETVVELVEPPRGDPSAPLRALIFDSRYDPYKGVVAYLRVVDGEMKGTERAMLMSAGVTADVLEAGFFSPAPEKSAGLATGQVGYLATGLKNVRDCRVGDTLTSSRLPATAPLAGYRPLKPMVFSGLYPADGKAYPELRDALDKLQLNDPALVFEPESSTALGFGFRCGFLGLLHMDIVQERLEREYDLSLIATAPGGELSGNPYRPERGGGGQPFQDAAGPDHRRGARAVGGTVDNRTIPLHRPGHGSGHRPARRIPEDGVPAHAILHERRRERPGGCAGQRRQGAPGVPGAALGDTR